MSNPTANLGMALPTTEWDDQKLAKINAAFQILDALFPAGVDEAWISWTPSWTALTVGNGIVIAKYMRIGKLVTCRLKVVLGSSSSVGTGVRFSLPVTKLDYGGTVSMTPLGQSRLFDTSTPANSALGTVVATSTTEVSVLVDMASGTYRAGADLTATVPFTWATGDEIGLQFSYEAA